MPSTSNVALGRLIVAASLISIAADSSPDGQVRFRPAVTTSRGGAVSLSTTEAGFRDRHCPLGIPEKQAAVADVLGPTTVIIREGYVLEHSAVSKTAYWVSERVTSQDLTGPDLGRLKPEPFRAEPWVSRGSRAELSDYRNSGYARGHMAPDADRTDDRLKAETYYLSNMVPQWGPFNSGVWLTLEKSVRSWACTRGDVLVITGPLWFEPEESDPSKADGQIRYYVIGANQVAVPTHLYKIVASRNPQSSEWETLAFVLPNQQKFPSKPPLEDYLTTIDWVEAQSGYDFLPDLEDAVEERLESTRSAGLWDIRDDCIRKPSGN